MLHVSASAHEQVLEQLRSGGVMEAVRVTRAGFPARYVHRAFLERFQLLAPTVRERDPRAACLAVMRSLTPRISEDDYQVGLTKVFFRQKVAEELEKRREAQLRRFVVLLQRAMRGWFAQRQYARLKATVPLIQHYVRARITRNRFAVIRLAVRKLQSGVRCVIARNVLRKLAEASVDPSKGSEAAYLHSMARGATEARAASDARQQQQQQQSPPLPRQQSPPPVQAPTARVLPQAPVSTIEAALVDSMRAELQREKTEHADLIGLVKMIGAAHAPDDLERCREELLLRSAAVAAADGAVLGASASPSASRGPVGERRAPALQACARALESKVSLLEEVMPHAAAAIGPGRRRPSTPLALP